MRAGDRAPRAASPRDGPGARTESRRRSLARLATEVFDVLVIGGGVTGCGVALDAASRGLSVALVEKRDFAAGTSSRSSKLIHGGLRYLERLDIGLVREALHERRLLLETIAPHLVKADALPLPLEAPRVGPLRHGVGPLPLRRAGRAALGGAAPPPSLAGGVPARRAVAARRCAPRRHPLLRRPGRRRALLGDARAHGDRPRRALRPGRRRRRVSPRGRAGSPGSACATSSRATSSRCAPGRSSTPPACGPRKWSVWRESRLP